MQHNVELSINKNFTTKKQKDHKINAMFNKAVLCQQMLKQQSQPCIKIFESHFKRLCILSLYFSSWMITLVQLLVKHNDFLQNTCTMQQSIHKIIILHAFTEKTFQQVIFIYSSTQIKLFSFTLQYRSITSACIPPLSLSKIKLYFQILKDGNNTQFLFCMLWHII